LQSTAVPANFRNEWKPPGDRARRLADSRNKLAHWVVSQRVVADARMDFRLHHPTADFDDPRGLSIADFLRLGRDFTAHAVLIFGLRNRIGA